MASNIATVLVRVPVIQLNNTIYIEDGQLVPQTLNVPCREAFIDLPYYWAVPIKDSGIFTTLEMIPKTDQWGNAIDQPSYDSFTVQRVRDKESRYTWWVIIDDSTSPPADFTDVCATCCGEEAVTLSGDVPLIVPCQTLCETSPYADGEFEAVFGAPALTGGQTYKANGAYNNVALPQITGATLAALVIQMNANWDTPSGSPSATFVWSNVGLVVFAIGGFENDSLCVLIETVGV